jgi:CRP/FNR family transcriptional regulator
MSALQADGIIVLEGKRQVQVPDIRRLIAETGDDVDGGLII